MSPIWRRVAREAVAAAHHRGGRLSRWPRQSAPDAVASVSAMPIRADRWRHGRQRCCRSVRPDM
eukprot:2219903-Pleurochrysis_carterae.AAC.2